MLEITTQIDIDAPMERVRRMVLDIDAYASWNPLYAWTRGNDVRPGSRLTFGLPLVGPLVVPMEVEVVTNNAERVSWLGPAPGPLHTLLGSHHRFEFVALEDGRTRLHHCEEYTGSLIALFWAIYKPVAVPRYHDFNQALKRRAEDATLA